MNLNERAHAQVEALVRRQVELRVAEQFVACGARIIDCGVAAPGGLRAGIALAKICLADLADVSLLPSPWPWWSGSVVQVITDHPVAACMASQYAGWQVSVGKFFAMGSGPMRAAIGQEPLYNAIGFREQTQNVVGVLESRKLPDDDVCRSLANQCKVSPDRLTLLVAPTASQAGNLQVVARSVETALHKLHELGFDLTQVASGVGVAPLPPVASDDLTGIGRTNDAILYGAHVTLHVNGDDATLERLAPRIPSSASRDHGRPFAEIFARYDHDFYKIDPHLFSPAVIRLANLTTGRAFECGRFAPEVLSVSASGS